MSLISSLNINCADFSSEKKKEKVFAKISILGGSPEILQCQKPMCNKV